MYNTKSKPEYGLGVIMMHQYRLTDCNKCTTLVVLGDADTGGGCACEGAGYTWEHYVIFAQFFYGFKTALKNKAYFLKNSMCF